MKLWLLLVSLLVSDLSPLGDGDWVRDCSWSLCRKLLQMTPLGLEILQTQTEHQGMCIQRKCVCAALHHKQRTSPFYWTHTVHDDHGCSLSHQEFTGIIHRNHIPALVVSLLRGKGKRVPAFLVRSDTRPAPHVISETGHIAMDIIKDHPDSESAWTLHHHTAASGHNFQAFLLEKSKRWAPATIVKLQKMLTKRYCAATTVTICCCFIEGEISSAMNISKIITEQTAQPQMRQTGMDILIKYDEQPVVSQHDIFQAATLHSDSSSLKTSDTSQLQIRRNSVRIMKINKHLKLLQKSAQKQQTLKAASSVSDGFYVEKQLSLVSREKTESINRLQHQIKATQDDNKEDFNGRIITKQAESRRPEGESETEQSHTNIANKKILAYILQATHKTDNNDHKQMFTEAGEEVLIMLFLPDTETQSSERKLVLNTDTRWKTVNILIKELDDPSSMTKVIEQDFIVEAESLKESLFSSERYDRTDRIDIKPAESTAKVTTVSVYTKEQVKETEEKIKHTETNHTLGENMGINQTKQEESAPSEESVITSPPSFKMTERKTEHIAETTTVNMEIKETTSSTEVFNQGGTQRDDSTPSTVDPRTTTSPESDAQPRFIKFKTGSIEATTERSFSGLRMRQDTLADTTKLHEITETEERAETERKEVQSDPKVDSFTFAKPSQTIHKQPTDKLQRTTDDNMPLCRGLIHRTEAGWKHCTERSAGLGSKDAFKDTSRDQKDNLLNDDEYNHFYYFDGVMRRVQNNLYPYYKRQRRRKRSHDITENSVFTLRKKGDTRENLLSYIQRLTLRNKASHLK